MSEELEKVDETKYREADLKIRRLGERFSSDLSPILPKAHLKVLQDAHWDIYYAGKCVRHAMRTYDHREKVNWLFKAVDSLFDFERALIHFVDGHGCTVGQANEVINRLREAYTDVDKFLESEKKKY